MVVKRKKKSSMRDKVRKRSVDRESQGGSGFISADGVEFHKPKKGTDKFRIVPYEVTAKNHPEVPAGELWYQRTVWVHYDVGADSQTVICPAKTIKKPCPICEHLAKLQRDPDADEDTLKELKPRERELFNVMLDGEDEIKLLTMSYHLFGKKLEEEVREGDEEWGGFADLEDGYMLNVRWAEKKLGKNAFLEASRIDFKQDDDLEESMLDEVCDLDAILNHKSYEEIRKLYYAEEEEEEGEEEEGEEEEEEEELPKRSRRSSKPAAKPSRRSRKPEPEEEGEDEEEDEEEPPKRSRRSSSKRSSRKPEPESEEEDVCPFGMIFGTDCNSADECDECDEWDRCQEAQDAAPKKKGRRRK